MKGLVTCLLVLVGVFLSLSPVLLGEARAAQFLPCVTTPAPERTDAGGLHYFYENKCMGKAVVYYVLESTETGKQVGFTSSAQRCFRWFFAAPKNYTLVSFDLSYEGSTNGCIAHQKTSGPETDNQDADRSARIAALLNKAAVITGGAAVAGEELSQQNQRASTADLAVAAAKADRVAEQLAEERRQLNAALAKQKQNKAAVAQQIAGEGAQRTSELVPQGSCRMDFLSSGNLVICWRLDAGFQRPSTSPCDPILGTYKGIPFRYCDGAW